MVITTLLFFGWSAGGSLTTTDGVLAYDLAVRLGDGQLSLSPSAATRSAFAIRGADGELFSPWGIGHALFGIPFVKAASMLQGLPRLDRLPADMLGKAFFAASSCFAGVLAVLACFGFGFHVSGSERRAFFAAAVLAACTPLWPYSGFGFNTALSAATLLSAVWAIWAARQMPTATLHLVAGAAMGTAVSVRHEFVMLAPIAAVWWLAASDRLSHRLRGLCWAIAGGAPFAMGVAAYNHARFGSILETGHTPAFALGGHVGLLLSPGASVLLYCPPVLLMGIAIARMPTPHRDLRHLLISTSGALFLFYGFLANWMGGRSYGPRYLVPVIALLCVPLALPDWKRSTGRRVLVGLLVVGFVVQIPAVTMNYAAEFDALAQTSDGRNRPSVGARMWDLDSSGLRVTSQALFSSISGRAEPASFRGPGSRFDLWWFHLAALDIIPRPAAIALSGFLLALLAFAARRTWGYAASRDGGDP